MKFLSNIYELVSNNQLLMTGLGLSGAGILTFWIKDVPRSIYNFIKRELTTSLIVTNQNKSFYEILNWIQQEFKNKNFRRLKLSNGRWGDDDNTTSIGYGLHWIRYNGQFILIDLIKEEANQTERDKETLVLMKLGRSRKLFDKFVNDIESMYSDINKTKLYKMDERYWRYVKEQPMRQLDSIFIEREKKELLVDTLSTFINKEQWYLDNGIPYQLGILLHGSPGTGKTSLIKAIAGHLQYPIYYLSPQKLSRIEDAMSILSNKCIVVIEDIDSNTLTHDRQKKNGESELIKELSIVSLSEILNSLDGMFSSHGRILIATTNHIEDLDPALIRPGRIDLKIEVGCVNIEILKLFMGRFYPESNIDYSEIKLKANVTTAMLQGMMLEGKSSGEILVEIVEKG